MMSRYPTFALLGAVLAAGCAAPLAAPDTSVVAVLQPTRGNTTAGSIWFTPDGSQVLVRGRVSGLVPNQEHGFHVHEKGDCSSGDGMSAGGHLNPGAKPHGPQTADHHAGDLPSLKADAGGNATVRMRVAGSVLGGGPGDFAGKALIVHVNPDDYVTQPTGNAGARIACAVISSTVGRDAAGNSVTVPRDL